MADGYLKRDTVLRMMRHYDGQHLYEALLYTEDADVRENIHGEWIEKDTPDAYKWKCSCCGLTRHCKENFCPNCGADMRGET